MKGFSGQVGILAAGRCLSQIGNLFTIFYAPILFVHQLGLSATAVGIGIGSGAISGVLGRFLGVSFADSPWVGRRGTLLLSAAISALADLVFICTHNLPIFIIGNLLMGLGIGLYWPATEAAVADLTTDGQRNETFAIMRLADNLGLSWGVVLGGALMAAEYNYRVLFAIDGISFIAFFGVVYGAIAETGDFSKHDSNQKLQGWMVAWRDRPLTLFLVVNIMFTTYLSQLQSTLPLYLSNFVSGFDPKIISGLFAWYIVFVALCQLPVARWLNRFSRPQALGISLLLWEVGFGLIWVTGVMGGVIWAILALSIMGLATAAYTPSASALVADLAPPSLRGIYMSINAQCWAIGYFIGPSLGGWALDRSRFIADGFWLVAAVSVGIGMLILQYLQGLLQLKN